MWIEVVRLLLEFRPFKKFYLVAGSREWFVETPKHLWIPDDSEVGFFGSEGTTDVLNMSRIEYVRIDDDFGMSEARQMMKQ
jgi:hypothetical protein